MPLDPEELAWQAVDRLFEKNDEGLRSLAEIERRESLREKLITKGWCRPFAVDTLVNLCEEHYSQGTDWRALCEELYLALCRPQRPPGELMDRAHEALYTAPLQELTQSSAQGEKKDV